MFGLVSVNSFNIYKTKIDLDAGLPIHVHFATR